jgi:hypothetical protein
MWTIPLSAHNWKEELQIEWNPDPGEDPEPRVTIVKNQRRSTAPFLRNSPMNA